MGVQPTRSDGARSRDNRSTWRDCLPPDAPVPAELFTREQLLTQLKRWRVEATEADLRYWEYEGVLPRPVRQWHEGAVRALYPAWFVPLVQHLRALQRRGLTLDEIAARMPAQIYLLSTYNQNTPPVVRREAERLAQVLERDAGIRVDQVTIHTSHTTDTEHRTERYTVSIPPSGAMAVEDVDSLDEVDSSQ